MVDGLAPVVEELAPWSLPPTRLVVVIEPVAAAAVRPPAEVAEAPVGTASGGDDGDVVGTFCVTVGLAPVVLTATTSPREEDGEDGLVVALVVVVVLVLDGDEVEAGLVRGALVIGARLVELLFGSVVGRDVVVRAELVVPELGTAVLSVLDVTTAGLWVVDVEPVVDGRLVVVRLVDAAGCVVVLAGTVVLLEVGPGRVVVIGQGLLVVGDVPEAAGTVVLGTEVLLLTEAGGAQFVVLVLLEVVVGRELL